MVRATLRVLATAAVLLPSLAAVCAPPTGGTPAIAWREGDVADAFAEARESGRPVLLYWGARWCPPCGRLKADLFPDPAFIAETRKFVPVHLDGDAKGAQAWGARFGIEGYPTIIILRPDGREVARLGEGVDPASVAGLLRATEGRQTTVAELLTRARTDPAALTPSDWTLLENFTWDDDTRYLADAVSLRATLDGLARAAPGPALRRRFALLALTAPAMRADDDDNITVSAADAAGIPALLDGILADPASVRANVAPLSSYGAGLVEAVPDPATRAALKTRLLASLARTATDTTLPLRDRLDTIRPELDFARAGEGDAAVARAAVRARVAAADHDAQAPMLRQSVITDAAFLLDRAGDTPGAERLLEAEVARSPTPFYAMSHLATLAEDHGDRAAALGWSRRAAGSAEGPATRVQWAAEYATLVLRLDGNDAAEVERSADAVVDEIGRAPDSYHERVEIKVARWAQTLRGWSKAHDGAPVLAQVETRLAPVCARQSDPKAARACTGLLATT